MAFPVFCCLPELAGPVASLACSVDGLRLASIADETDETDDSGKKKGVSVWCAAPIPFLGYWDLNLDSSVVEAV